VNGFLAVLSIIILAAPQVYGGGFLQSSSKSLVVVRMGEEASQWQQDSSAKIYLDEYDVTQQMPRLVNTIALPATGNSACTLTTNIGWHDGHLHLSANGQFLTLAAYRCNCNASYDPADELARIIPRVVARIDMQGNINTSTALTDSFDYGAIRGAVTDDGTRFWMAGANASGANDGGLRFALINASTSVNLSKNQFRSCLQPPTSDNPRDVGIYENQLYVCSGSASSIGKAVLKYGQGLPVTGTNYIRLTTDNADAQSFVFLDLSSDIPGADTLYTASSTGATLRKYSLVGGVWITKGLITVPGIENVTAMCKDGQVVLYVATNYEIFQIIDNTGYNGELSGTISTPCIVAGVNRQFRGLQLLHN
jgi:hypothetical protein